MKRKILFVMAVVLTVGFFVVGYTQSSKSAKSSSTAQSSKEMQREERHRLREERRAQRLQEYEHYMDSIVLARNFQFNPSSMQQQPAGATRMLNNPNFLLSFWGTGEVDVCLPYIKGVTPPYYYVIINYTLPMVMNYVAEQTHEGWLVTFSSTLFSATEYKFSLEIYSTSGTATLTISTPWYPDVQYSGTITGLN